MKKKKIKLSLNKETLRSLETHVLHEVGGATDNFSNCNPSACPTICITRCVTGCFTCEDCGTIRTCPP
jgi:hypothetical protein